MAFAEVGAGSQRATANQASVNSKTLAFPSGVTAGNLLVVCGSCFVLASGGPATISVTDSQGAYTVLSATQAADDFRLFIAYRIASASGPNTVTVDPVGSSSDLAFSIDEFSGVDTGTPLDVDGGSSTGTSTAPADSITTIAANALIIAVVSFGGATTTITKGGSFTQIGQSTSTSAGQPEGCEFQIATTPTSYSANFTLGASRPWTVYAASFNPLAGMTVGEMMAAVQEQVQPVMEKTEIVGY
jgi:hypothetical protein